MAKKRGNRRAAPEDADDESSTTSTSTGCMQGTQEYGEPEADLFETCLEELYEKRASTREKALQNLIGLLREGVQEEQCARSASTLVGRCSNCMRKGGAAESALAATLLGLHILTLGEQNDSLFAEISPDLEKVAVAGKSVACKAAAIESLAVCCFVAAEDFMVTLQVMNKLRGLWRADSPKVKAAALRSWSLLFISLPNLPGSDAVEDVLSALSVQLHDADVEVRGAAGEAVALLYHACGFPDMLGAVDEEDAEDEDPAGADVMSVHSASTAVSGLDDVMDRMKDLASNKGDLGGMRRSRRDRAALRGTFRELCSILEDGETPAIKVKLQHGDSLVLNTLPGCVTMNFLKRFLAGGFQAHMQANAVLHAVFDFAPLQERPERLSALEKRAYRSPNSGASKARAQDRKLQRAHKPSAGSGWL